MDWGWPKRFKLKKVCIITHRHGGLLVSKFYL